MQFHETMVINARKYLVSPVLFDNVGYKWSVEETDDDQCSPSLLLMEEVRLQPDL